MAKVPFGSEQWVKSLQNELNTSEAYADAAKNWEGDFYFVVDPEGPVVEPIYLYFDLWHGKARDAFVAQDKNAKKPAYIMYGPYSKWKKVVSGQLDPLQALATGQLKLKGNLVAVMKQIRAAQEIVRACIRIDTEFPA